MAVSKNQGFYIPLKKEKWKGDVNHIVFRSFLEYKIFRHLELLENVKEIYSEEIVIPYLNPVDGKWHRYFPDLVVKVIDKDGNEVIYIIEIKPYNETIPPKKTKRTKETTYIKRVSEYLKNKAKWEYAEKFCKDRGWNFLILTEKDIK